MAENSHSVKLKYVKLGYQYLVNNILTFLLVPIMLTILIQLLQSSPNELLNFYNSLSLTSIHIVCSLFLITYVTTCYIMSRPRTIYLVDHACFRPPMTCRVPFASFMEHASLILPTEPKSVRFQMKMLERSGLGEETALPPAMHYIPPTPTMDLAREEAELVIFSAMDALLAKTGLKPKDIDVLIVNCSLFSPTPSLSAMVINKYKLRSNIKSFNLSGMGCSAGVISIDLARDILQIYPNSNAVVISTEILTPNGYLGKHIFIYFLKIKVYNIYFFKIKVYSTESEVHTLRSSSLSKAEIYAVYTRQLYMMCILMCIDMYIICICSTTIYYLYIIYTF